jgi:hypothetical protein
MRKRVTLLISALMVALSMSFSGVAFADIGKNHKNPGGHKPPGQTPNPNPGK